MKPDKLVHPTAVERDAVRERREPAPAVKVREVKRELVTTERAAVLRDFEKDLAALCDRYGVDIHSSPDAEDMIEVSERNFEYPEGYTFSANFTGVDKGGVWSNLNPQTRKTYGLEIERWWYEEQEARAGGAL